MTSRKPTHMVRKTWPRQSYVFEWTRQTCFRLNETRLCLLHSKAIQRVYQVWQVLLQLFRRQSCKRKENNSKTTIISALMRDEILANQQVQEWNNFRHLYKASSPCEAQTHISMKSTMSSFVLDLRYSWWSTPFLWIIDCIVKYTDTPLNLESQNNYDCITQAIIVFPHLPQCIINCSFIKHWFMHVRSLGMGTSNGGGNNAIWWINHYS